MHMLPSTIDQVEFRDHLPRIPSPSGLIQQVSNVFEVFWMEFQPEIHQVYFMARKEEYYPLYNSKDRTTRNASKLR